MKQRYFKILNIGQQKTVIMREEKQVRWAL